MTARLIVPNQKHAFDLLERFCQKSKFNQLLQLRTFPQMLTWTDGQLPEYQTLCDMSEIVSSFKMERVGKCILCQPPTQHVLYSFLHKMSNRSDHTVFMWDTLLSHVGDIASSEHASPFPCPFDGESVTGVLLIAFWSRWSRFPSVQRGRRRSLRGTSAICSNALLSSHKTQSLCALIHST